MVSGGAEGQGEVVLRSVRDVNIPYRHLPVSGRNLF